MSGSPDSPQARNFDEYWLGYLAGHSKPLTRFLHYLGLFFAPLAGILASILYAWWAFLIIAPVFYMIAFFTHPMLEHNSNAPYAERPAWSGIALLKMLALDVIGRLGPELRRAGVPARATS